MKDKITFQTLITDVAGKTGNTEQYTEQYLKEFTAIIEEGLLQDGQVNIKGLGIFKLKWVKEKTNKNAQTGEIMTVPAHSRVVYKPEKPLREYVNRKYAQQEQKPVAVENGQDKKLKSPTNIAIAATISVFSLSAVLAYFWFSKHNS